MWLARGELAPGRGQGSPPDGIERIHAEAGGWPHLVQLIAEPLLEHALDQAIVSGHNVLYELLRSESSLVGEWKYLSKFRSRETQPPPDDEAIAQSLRRRLLVGEESGHCGCVCR